MRRVAIIGGGASALMCALFVSSDCQTVIYEAGTKLGKKILASGNGRCNLTNENMSKHSYNQNIDKYLSRFNFNDAVEYFKSIGVETYSDGEGRCYPISNTSSSVLDAMLVNLQLKSNITFKLNTPVCKIVRNGAGFYVYADGKVEYYDKIVIATGNGINFDIIDKLGIKHSPFFPSLCSLKTDSGTGMDGVRISPARVTCDVDGVEFKEIGEVLFKKDGISGIVIFNLSSYMARKKCYNFDVKLDFLPKISYQNLILRLKTRKLLLKEHYIKDFFVGMFCPAIAEKILSASRVNYDAKVRTLTDHQIEAFADKIKNYKMRTVGAGDNNQVCSGGILMDELDENLQSKKLKGLYFCGEVVDVDGVCGGYNLQWAWTSGKIVGENL